MDDAQKFQELKQLKNSEKKRWVKKQLETQIEQDHMKRLHSKEHRRAKADATYGPQESEETLLYSLIKKQRDIDIMKSTLGSQMNTEQAYKLLNHRK